MPSGFFRPLGPRRGPGTPWRRRSRCGCCLYRPCHRRCQRPAGDSGRGGHQQLARLSVEQLEVCRSAVEALHGVCSFTALSSTDYLDADWYPTSLLDAAQRAQAEPELLASLTLAFQGGAEVNPAYRDVPDSVWEHPVTSLPPDTVTEVAAALDRLLLSGFPADDLGVRGLREAFRAVSNFYSEAVGRGLAVVMWWD